MCQVRAGLTDPKTRKLIKKPTKFLDSDEKLVAYLRPRLREGRRQCAEHTQIAGDNSAMMQIRPWKLAKFIANGVADLLRDHWSPSAENASAV
eukprot:13354356-Heterocapsa_arctica.AAC.1